MNHLTTSPALLPSIDSIAVAALRESLSGRVIFPGDPDYDRARAVWNGMIDRYPALVVSCATVSDVVAAVDFARSQRSARGGARRRAQRGRAFDL